MATWYAQNSSVNIDSVNQWNSAADGSGSWLTWASLDPSDILVANGKTSIAINVDTTCALLTNVATGGTAGGGFILAPGVTLTASITCASVTCVARSASGSESFIIGSVTAAVGTNIPPAVVNSSTGVLTITGNVTALAGTNCVGVQNASSGTVNVTGQLAAGTSNSGGGNAVVNHSTGTVNITGNCAGASAGVNNAAAVNVSSGSMNITGNCVGGGAGTTTDAVRNNGTGTLTIVGTVTGGQSVSAFGVLNMSTGRVNITGNVVASPVNSAIQNSGQGSFLVNGNFVCDPNGTQAIGRGVVLIPETALVQHQYRSGNFFFDSACR